MRILLSSLVVIVLGITAVKGGPFTATLTTPRVQEMGEDVMCTVVITNNNDEEYYLLKRYTPLEGLRSHIFSIKKDAKSAIKYDGFIFKMGSPSEKEYVRIAAKSSLSSTVVLSKAYSFDSPSVYSVKLNTQLLYSKSLTAAPLSQQLSSNEKHFFLMDTGKPPKPTEPEALRRKQREELLKNPSHKPQANSQGYVDPTFLGGWPSSEQTITETAYATAYSKIGESYNAVDTKPDKYKIWFGQPTSERKAEVKLQYGKILLKVEEYSYQLNYYGGYCEKGVFAYTWYRNLNIHLCEAYFNAPATGYDSKFGTIIHELSHAAADTDDVPGFYGTSACKRLARNKPGKAVTNADNYEYFAESL